MDLHPSDRILHLRDLLHRPGPGAFAAFFALPWDDEEALALSLPYVEEHLAPLWSRYPAHADLVWAGCILDHAQEGVSGFLKDRSNCSLPTRLLCFAALDLAECVFDLCWTPGRAQLIQASRNVWAGLRQRLYSKVSDTELRDIRGAYVRNWSDGSRPDCTASYLRSMTVNAPGILNDASSFGGVVLHAALASALGAKDVAKGRDVTAMAVSCLKKRCFDFATGQVS